MKNAGDYSVDRVAPLAQTRTMDKRQFFFILSASLIFTVVVIQWSYRSGRLSMDPVYDDVIYLLDARERLNDFDQQGIGNLLHSLWHKAPHSPWSTAAATAGFLIFGVNAWAPYAVNGLLVMGFLLAADHFFQVRNFWPRALISLVILALPMTVRAVHDFRPDFAVALITAIACLKTIELGLVGVAGESANRRRFLGGLLFGLAYLIKPSFVYHTTALLLVSLFLSEATLWFRGLPSIDFGSHWFTTFLGRMGIFSAGCLAVSGLYYVKNWQDVLSYVAVNTGSGKDASYWRDSDSIWATLKAYVIGDLSETFGSFLWIISAAIWIGLIFNALREEWRRAAFISAGLICALVSLGIVCVSQISNDFFGLTWQILIVLTAVFSIGTLNLGSAPYIATIMFAVAIGSTRVFQPPFQKVWQVYPDALRSQSINEALVKRFKKLIPVNPGDHRKNSPFIFVTFAGGVVDAYTQQWVAEEERYPGKFFNLPDSRSLEGHRQMIARADIVEVASENADAYWIAEFFPSSHLRKELLGIMRTDPAFFEVAPVRGQGGTVYVFVRKAAFRVRPETFDKD